MEVDQDGIVVAVYCPDETYIVDLLDHADWNRDAGYGHVDQSLILLQRCSRILQEI